MNLSITELVSLFLGEQGDQGDDEEGAVFLAPHPSGSRLTLREPSGPGPMALRSSAHTPWEALPSYPCHDLRKLCPLVATPQCPVPCAGPILL